ncbi:alpha/beta hydrolase [Ruegeria sp. SCPT10]|uniref:alpha/beta hydrolase n=1 Tax=Ruegeria sp. SCP10 TaxID=3141377 RepID=UPI00333D4BBD
MTTDTGIDWTEAFANASYIPGGMEFPARWEQQAAAFRKSASRAQIDIAYGNHPRERLDLFLPEGKPNGLAVIVHGGYWLNFDKSYWSHLANGALKRGWAVALPSYVLAPEAAIADITQQIAQAIAEAAARCDGPVCLAGHSAGGHLVTRMVCENTPLPPQVADRIARVVSISGLHDLRPLQFAQLNEKLCLNTDSAAAESPVLHTPVPGTDLVCWVGNDERPEFLRQSALLAETWRRAGATTRLHSEPGRHHFNVIEDLCDPESALVEAFVGTRS